MNDDYFRTLEATIDGVVTTLTGKAIQPRHLSFGGQGPLPTKKVSVPTDARSEFLANRAMGDWAEQTLSQSLAKGFTDYRIVQYGNTDRIAAGDPAFRERYLSGVEETRVLGKRPDLLIFPSTVDVPLDISGLSQAETEPLVQQALAAIEVRSSKFEALTYIAERQRRRDAGGAAARETPSFTVKVEDLIIVYRWLERNRVPQSYCQVFFDSLFAINFLEIFRVIASGQGFVIDKPANSQEKATIMIPITRGLRVGTATSLPSFAAEHRVTQLGRHDAYVVPQGGGFIVDEKAMRTVLFEC